MCGEPFTITPHESLTCSSTDKTVLQQELPVQSSPLGKRKTREDEQLSEGNDEHYIQKYACGNDSPCT